MAEGLSAVGVSEAHLVEDERLDDYAPAAWAQSVVELIEELEPEAVMASGTERGNEELEPEAVMASGTERGNEVMAASRKLKAELDSLEGEVSALARKTARMAAYVQKKYILQF